MNLNPTSALRKATDLARQGQHGEAAQLYRAVLAKFPLREDANRGLLAALEAQGAWDELEAVARGLTQRQPQLAAAWLVLARVLLTLQKDALEVCQRCVKLDARNSTAHDYLGVAYRRAGRLEEAALALQAALKLRPGHLSTKINLANVWRELGQLPQALRLFKEVLQADPGKLEAAYNYSLALVDVGDFRAAEAQLQQLLAQAPGLADAHNALGSVLHGMNQLPAAEQAFKAALALKPEMPEAISNLALTLHALGKLSEMQTYLGRAVDLMPTSSRLRLAEVVAALPKIARDAADAQQQLQQFDAQLDAYGRWRASALQDGSLRHDSLANLPFILAYRQGDQKERLSRFSDLATLGKKGLSPRFAPGRQRAPDAPIRLGIVSSHIRRHSVWDVVLKGLVTHIDRQAFELTVYHLGYAEDAQTEFARTQVHRWRDASSLGGGQSWAELIAADEQDLLFYPELGMDPASYMLAQQRLAPLQAAGWGHPITTGIAAIDLYFSGELLEPEGAQAHYRERLITLPGTGCCTSPYEVQMQPSAALQALRAATSAPLLLIAQSVLKFDPAHDTVWVQIAQRLGDCHFVIPVADTMAEAAQLLAERLGRAFSQAGLDPAAYLRWVPWLSEGEFRHALQVCQVFLDCPSFSGYTTAWKALREGIPMVSWDGPFMRQRLAAGLLKKVGLTEGVAATLADYVDLAVALAQESPAEHQARRQRIACAAPLADHDLSVVRAFEQALQAGCSESAARWLGSSQFGSSAEGAVKVEKRVLARKAGML